jgi:biopolymer transport protein ExbD
MAELNTTQKMGSNRTKKLSTRVDLTAMVDLAFLLITFFMLTTTLSKPVAMSLSMPVGKVESKVKASNTLTLCLGANNRVVWYTGTNEEPTDLSVTGFNKNEIRLVLMNRLKEILDQTGENLMVLIKPSDKSQYKDLVDVLDELHITNVPSYAIVDISKEDIDRLKRSGIY